MFNRRMLSLEEISDRLEIQQLLIDYSTAIDRRDSTTSTGYSPPDAYIDYRAIGGIDGRFPEVKAWLARGAAELPGATPTCWATSTSASTATPRSSRTICFNPMVLGGEQNQILFCRPLVRRRVRPHRRGLADEPPRRDQVLRQGGVGCARRLGPPCSALSARPLWTSTARARTSWTQHDAHRTSRRAALPTAFLIRSERYTETKTLKMSSRSRVSLELVMRHCPSIFS